MMKGLVVILDGLKREREGHDQEQAAQVRWRDERERIRTLAHGLILH